MQVVDTAQQVGRFSVSTAPDLPYKEMASHCEALLMGKQQKMSSLMTVQQENLFSLCIQNVDLQPTNTAPYLQVNIQFVDFKTLFAHHVDKRASYETI